MPFIGHRENSRIGWGKVVNGKDNSSEGDIQLGCLLRIADATEAMAKDHTKLLRDFDRYKNRNEQLERENARIGRSNAALRGVITKLKAVLDAR